ncbi:MAG: gliding motility-associated C-terminal domain-containing protein [Bacteroidetes bacterium]|nr:gliding motility-associated C-terminal domain-containing protein [Bacteroidota bacterium]
MKIYIYLFAVLIPGILCAQNTRYQPSQLDTIWRNVGNPGFSAGHAGWTSLAFGPSGEPYVAYQDSVNSRKSTVMRFNGTNWVNVVDPGFSAGEVDYTSLAFSPSGKPYVEYMDHFNGWFATVMKFDTLCFVAPAGPITGPNQVCQGTSGYLHLMKPGTGENCLVVYKVLTPNGDKLNDRWLIYCIENYPVNKVENFNYWVDLVSSISNYDNITKVWNGTDKIGDVVPDGTYYYLISIKNAQTLKGWVFVRAGLK